MRQINIAIIVAAITVLLWTLPLTYPEGASGFALGRTFLLMGRKPYPTDADAERQSACVAAFQRGDAVACTTPR